MFRDFRVRIKVITLQVFADDVNSGKTVTTVIEELAGYGQNEQSRYEIPVCLLMN